MYAHCFKVSGGYELTITQDVRPVGGTTVKCISKKEARALAAKACAVPWNF